MPRRRKRGHGEGIEELPSGRFRAVLPGRVRKGRTRTFPTKAEAQQWRAARLGAKLAEGTVADWCESWLEIQESHTAASSYARDGRVVKALILPWLGDVPLRDLDAARIGKWLADLRREKKTDDQRHRAFRTLKKIVRAHPTLPNSLLEKVRSPKVDRAETRSLTWEEYGRLVATADSWEDTHPFLGAMVRVWVECCCRPRELLALHWDDYADGVVSVRRTLCPETAEPKPPKTKAGVRDVPLSPETRTVLEGWKGRCGPPAPQMWPAEKTDNGYVLYTTLWKTWKKLLKAAGLDESLKPYCLRHTGCSLLVAEGASILAVARRMGHANAQMILTTYGHAMPDDQAKLADVFARRK